MYKSLLVSGIFLDRTLEGRHSFGVHRSVHLSDILISFMGLMMVEKVRRVHSVVCTLNFPVVLVGRVNSKIYCDRGKR